jgi:hypothetical protein
MTHNQGHPMSIIDIAAAFPVKDYTITNWGSNVTSYIDCGARQLPTPSPHQPSLTANQTQFEKSPASGYVCSNATFVVNRSLIDFPVLSGTADQIYNRIIPAPGGDCKLLSDPVEGIYLSLLDLTITGRPVGIACNITINNTEGVNPTSNFYGIYPSNSSSSKTYSNGSTLLVYNPSKNTTSNYTLPSSNSSLIPTSNSSTIPTSNSSTIPTYNSSTSGGSINSSYVSPIISTNGQSSGAYENPPPPSLFAPYNASNAICITSTTGSLCLPNGTYDTLNGTLGFSSKFASTLNLPLGASLVFSLPSEELSASQNVPINQGSIGDQLYNTTLLFGQNITSGSSQEFTNDMTLLAGSGRTFNAIVNSPPGLCLYASMDFMGDVRCFGLGAGNITGPITTKALSLSLKGDAVAWLYAESYGDLGGTFVSTNISDMTELPYGTQKSFAGNVKALWISLPQ